MTKPVVKIPIVAMATRKRSTTYRMTEFTHETPIPAALTRISESMSVFFRPIL
ncbi:hypothetical protein DPMN_094547 [Dreissena polymorpha]|uniref:Uncharacterized protein n=1 Tax=Dreissena polymorpha TaxID=45954 RepID=A0A9D4L4X9_DREPO|nr:hypothetical protein DPMN_094547 [Dreissena polymorpha]